ncbi:MAG: M28 family peptidase [Thermoanaerobaculia bacterium]
MIKHFHPMAVAALLIAGCVTAPVPTPEAVAPTATAPAAAPTIPPVVQQSFDAFRAEAIRAHTRYLSSDELEGRGPGTRGDALATKYIAAQFEAAGLEPAGDGGTYFQKVALIGLATVEKETRVRFVKKGGNAFPDLHFGTDFVGADQTQDASATIDSEVIFVGHGVQAPEYRWDDYKGLDVRGKTLVMLVNDPPASAQEPELFEGRRRTYYGRWTYKFETGTALGAKAVLLVHTSEGAGYGWSVVKNSWSGENGYVKREPGSSALSFAGWLSEKTAQELFAAAGLDLAEATKAAASRDFKPVALNVRFDGKVATRVRPFETANVVARLAGSDPALSNEAVIYTAHHDHLGIGAPDEDDPTDTIYNGAIDNATGTAAVIEIARVWANAPRPKRSIYFATVAAEEQGLLGSEFLAKNPPVPSGRIALALNLDALSLRGKVGSITMNGVEKTTFLDTATRVTRALDLKIIPDQAPEQGGYYRSDHFSLAKTGVPAFSIGLGSDVIGRTPEWVREKSREYGRKHYHQPSDEFDPSWDFASAVQAGHLTFWLGWEGANAPVKPDWLAGAEFKAVRDEAIGALTK